MNRPNIVLVMTDQQRAGWTAASGFALDTMPFLDGLMSTGVQLPAGVHHVSVVRARPGQPAHRTIPVRAPGPAEQRRASTCCAAMTWWMCCVAPVTRCIWQVRRTSTGSPPTSTPSPPRTGTIEARPTRRRQTRRGSSSGSARSTTRSAMSRHRSRWRASSRTGSSPTRSARSTGRLPTSRPSPGCRSPNRTTPTRSRSRTSASSIRTRCLSGWSGPTAPKRKGGTYTWLRRLIEEKRPGYDDEWRRYRANYCGMLRLIDDQLRRLLHAPARPRAGRGHAGVLRRRPRRLRR